MMTFYEFLRLEAGATPPPPDPTGGGAPGADPLAGMGGGGGGAAPPPPGGGDMPGGDMGAGGAAGMPQQPRQAIHVTTWEDALRSVLGKSAHRPVSRHSNTPIIDKSGKEDKEEKKKPRSLLQ